MNPAIPTLAVSCIYVIWHAYLEARRRASQDDHNRLLRERVTFLLWKAAEKISA